MISVRQAERIILARMPALPAMSCPLAEASGRVLREDIRADRDFPPCHRVMMDGIAISSAAWRAGVRRFTIQATRQAGQPPVTLRNAAASCIEIMTGAVLPKGCDAVVPYEQLDMRGKTATLRRGVRVRPMHYVHRKGQDRKKGSVVLKSGSLLRSPQIAILASVGKSRIRVSALPSVAVVSNGDELVEPGRPLAPHQIRPSNTYGIRAALRSFGLSRVTPLLTRDNEKQIARTLRSALARHDILILSGGVSMGRYDFIPTVLARLGAKPLFHKVSQRPGKPFWFGLSRDGKPVFALPGNPVAVMVSLHRYVLPALRAAIGVPASEAETAVLMRRIDFGLPLTYFPPVRTTRGRDGRLRATPVRYNNSGDGSALGESDGFIELPPGRRGFAAGTVVRFHRWTA